MCRLSLLVPVTSEATAERERTGIIPPGDCTSQNGGGATLYFNKINSLLNNAESLTKPKLCLSKTDWQKKLTPEQFHVTREKGTEAVSRTTHSALVGFSLGEGRLG